MISVRMSSGAAVTARAPVDRVEAVTRAISEYISYRKLEPGQKLPTERELMAYFSVGRSTVREVLRQLQTLGIVETRKGSGSYLRRPYSTDVIHLPLTIDASGLRDKLLQTLEVRRGLETEVSALAAKRSTPYDHKIIEQRLIEMESVHLRKGSAGPEDLAFHLAIYDAAHNPLFRQLLEQMREAFERFWRTPFNRSDFASRSFPFHRPLFEAIRDGDAEEARRQTRAILAIVEDDIKVMSK
jgi:DNA-binding FadR family transcriptional regulator